MHKGRGFTLLEIIIATIILSLTVLGLMGVFLSGNSWVLHFRERATSAELGKLFVDPLQMDVRQDTWDSNELNVSADPVPRVNQTINNRIFTTTYTVADGKPASANYDPVLANTELRRVSMTVNWEEAATKP